MELLDTFVKECIQAYTMPNSFIHNSSSGILLKNVQILSSQKFQKLAIFHLKMKDQNIGEQK